MSQTTALLLTLLIEVPLVVGIVTVMGWAPGRLRQVALVSAGATLLTHPLLWMAADVIRTLPALLRAELLVALVEAAAYGWAARLGWRRGLLLSCLANATTLAVGLWLAGRV